jgi:hypothetical protein
MSRRANCWDNAPVESFFASLREELTRGEMFASREEARARVFESIEVFDNRVGRDSSLGYKSPIEYERAGSPLTPRPTSVGTSRMSLVTSHALAIVESTLQEAHGEGPVAELSWHQVVAEVSHVDQRMMLAVRASNRGPLRDCDAVVPACTLEAIDLYVPIDQI